MVLDGIEHSRYSIIEPELAARILYLKSYCFNKLGHTIPARECLFESAVVCSQYMVMINEKPPTKISKRDHVGVGVEQFSWGHEL